MILSIQGLCLIITYLVLNHLIIIYKLFSSTKCQSVVNSMYNIIVILLLLLLH